MQVCGQISVFDTSFKAGRGVEGSVNALVVQSDGRILVGGEFTTINGCSNSYLARLSSEGVLDPTFNSRGQTDGFVQCMRQQPDGKVLVGGRFGRIVGQERTALARLMADGSLDASFLPDPPFETNSLVSSLALQDDGAVLVSYYEPELGTSRITRFSTNGTTDVTFLCTNQFGSYILTMLPLSNGDILCGGNPTAGQPDPRDSLFRLQADGRWDSSFDPGLDTSSVFCLAMQPDGKIIVGGLLNRVGASNSVPLLRLNPQLLWDDTFQTASFRSYLGFVRPVVDTLLFQPDGKIILGGVFAEVGGYYRRNLVRLTADWQVDGCFDTGLGLWEGVRLAPVGAMAIQADGRAVIGGDFCTIENACAPRGLARLLPLTDCNAIRTFITDAGSPYLSATFPPGGTNYVEVSTDLRHWEVLASDVSPYIYSFPPALTNPPRAFYRGRQVR